MYIETERQILDTNGQTLQCRLQTNINDTWLQQPNAIQKVEELFLCVFGKLAEAAPGRHDLDTFCAEIKQAIWDWEHE